MPLPTEYNKKRQRSKIVESSRSSLVKWHKVNLYVGLSATQHNERTHRVQYIHNAVRPYKCCVCAYRICVYLSIFEYIQGDRSALQCVSRDRTHSDVWDHPFVKWEWNEIYCLNVMLVLWILWHCCEKSSTNNNNNKIHQEIVLFVLLLLLLLYLFLFTALLWSNINIWHFNIKIKW